MNLFREKFLEPTMRNEQGSYIKLCTSVSLLCCKNKSEK